MNRKLAVIGAGEAARPILIKAKQMNVDTYCFATKENSLAVDYPDYFYDINIFSIDEIFDKLTEIKPDGIIASSEITTEVTAILAQKLGLPGNSVIDGFAARNKYLMRKRISDVDNLYQPKFSLFSNEGKYCFPVIVKPVDSFGKKGIFLVNNYEDLTYNVEKAKSISTNGQVLIEEYIEGGAEYSVECLSNFNRVDVVQITQKENSGPPHFVELAHHQPAEVDKQLYDKICEISEKILLKLGIVCGMAHLEIKVKDNDIYFIEVGARAGGDRIGDTLVALSTDFDYYRAAIEVSLGVFKHKAIHTVAYSGIYFLCEQTKDLLPLFDDLVNSPWCYEYKLFNNNFMEIAGNGDDRLSGYLIYKADHKITLNDAYNIVTINSMQNAYDLLYQFNDITNSYSSCEKNKETVNKFLKYGDVLGIIKNHVLIAMLNLYCNNLESLEAYICNVYVLNNYRQRGLARKLISQALSIADSRGFNKVTLHVAPDNKKAISLYLSYGFEFTGNCRMVDYENLEEMCKII